MSPFPEPHPQKNTAMLSAALVFLIVALIAAAFGFQGVAGVAVGFARILFFIFVILFLVALVTGM